MRRWARILAPAVVLACSSLDEGEAGVVALEIRVPAPAVVEVGETIQFTAKPLDADGDSVGVAVTWRSADSTIVSVDGASGLVTGLAPGNARVQATVGSLSSELVQLTVIAPADTLILVGDSVVAVPAEPGITGPLTVLLESRNPAGPLGSRPVIYEITRPTGEPAVVTLSGSAQLDTLTTAADGTAAVTVNRVPGTPVPDTVLVEIRATRTRGAPVPGSGQRFIVLFQ